MLIKAGTDGVAPETATVKLRLAVNDGKNYIEGPAYLTLLACPALLVRFFR